MNTDTEVTDTVEVDGITYRRMNNESANVELERRTAEGWHDVEVGRVSGEVPPPLLVWWPIVMGDPVWSLIASGAMAMAPTV